MSRAVLERGCAGCGVLQVSWQGLLNHFLARVASSTSLVLLLDAGYPSSLEGVAAQLALAAVDCAEHPAACAVAASIDDGYRLYTAVPAEGAAHAAGGAAQHARQPVVVLLGKTAFPAPLWVQRNGSAEADIAATWRTPHCSATPYLTTKFLNWCAAAMLPRACMAHPQRGSPAFGGTIQPRAACTIRGPLLR